MLRRLRMMLLLYVLLFIAVDNWLARLRATDWNEPLWVDIYPINGDGSAAAQRHIDRLREQDFDAIEQFLKQQAADYRVAVDPPAELKLAPAVHELPPSLPATASIWDSLVWSLKLRWWAKLVAWKLDRPSPDIQVFAIYYDDEAHVSLDRSAALEKGRVAVAHLFADRRMRGPNQVVLTHELLHTLGASDKYRPGTNLPVFPEGYGEPNARPLYPQRRAELMAGRIAVAATHAEIPPDLGQVIVGPLTAAEIGWLTRDKLRSVAQR